MLEHFAAAARHSWRWPSVRGELLLEQLWQLPLQSSSGFDLDTVAKTVKHVLTASTEESFVVATPHPKNAEHLGKLELVKFVIAEKLAAVDKAHKARIRAIERRRLLEALEHRENQELSSASKDQLLERLAALDE